MRDNRLEIWLPLDRQWKRCLLAPEWQQILSSGEIRVECGSNRKNPIIGTSIDLLGNITNSIDRRAWDKLTAAQQTEALSRHCAQVERAMARIALPHDALEGFVRTVRWAVAGSTTLFGGVTWLLHDILWGLGWIALGTFLQFGVRTAVRYSIRTTARSWLGP